jgi:cytochrome bd-type quinol oxidase subunit 1
VTPIEFPFISAKAVIGFFGLTHIAIGSLAIGIAFFVTVAQVVAYRTGDRRYDLLAKRAQLINVCIYNIGTILAVGLIFSLSGLFPQFWSQIFVHMFWPLIVEEWLFFLLATTITFHYFFWEHMWGHKKLHILLGSMLTPLFLLQVYIINAMGSFMLTPGFREAEVSLRTGILGWDPQMFFNPSNLMLNLHRAFANVAYGSFVFAAICGLMLYWNKREKMQAYYEDGGRLAFATGFMAFLSLPIIGYFYAHVLRSHANEAYVNLMWGKGDIIAGGIDWWWTKHLIVAVMVGGTLRFFQATARSTSALPVPSLFVYAIGTFYLMFYLAMGMIMTWAFFFWMLAAALTGAFLVGHLFKSDGGSARGVYLLIGILSITTVTLGGYAREAARPRFVNRISAHDKVYVPEERAPYLMVNVDPADIPPAPEKTAGEVDKGVILIRRNCTGCHTLERVKYYKLTDWNLIVEQMRGYGLKISNDEADLIADYLRSKKPY